MPDRAEGAIAPAELSPRVFSTSGLPAAQRVERWESHNAAALVGLAVRAADPLDAAELNVQLPRARLARVTGSAHSVARTPTLIRRFPADSVVVYLTLRGAARFIADGVAVGHRPGDAVVWESDRPFARTFEKGLEELVVTVPCSEFTTRCSLPRLAGPVIASFGVAAGRVSASAGRPDQYARALARIAGRAVRAERPLPADERTVLDLVAVLAAGRHAAGAAAHRAVARSYIEERLTDPGLGAAEVAAAAGISERQLSRLFAADGSSIPRHILDRRLQLARSILSAAPADCGRRPGGRAAPTVADVAALCGFTSAAYFSHAFRQHFGHRASDLRPDPASPGF